MWKKKEWNEDAHQKKKRKVSRTSGGFERRNLNTAALIAAPYSWEEPLLVPVSVYRRSLSPCSHTQRTVLGGGLPHSQSDRRRESAAEKITGH